MMDTDKLASMASQIAAFFRAYPAEEAKAGIKKHLEAFWTPKMLDAMMTRGPHAGVDPLVTAALWTEPAAESPVRARVFEPELGGALMSDAG